MTPSQAELSALEPLAQAVKSFGWIALIIGLLAMAILQTAKDLLPWRKVFQKRWIKLWLREGIDEYFAAEKPSTRQGTPASAKSESLPPERISSLLRFREAVQEAQREAQQEGPRFYRVDTADSLEVQVAMRDFTKLATAGTDAALFGLPVEQLCGQINAAVQLALEHPFNHVVFLWAVGKFVRPDDLDEILNPPLEQLRMSQGELKPQDREKLEAYAGARTRVSQRLQRAVDGFQILAGNRWKLALQSAAIGLSMVLTSLALIFTNHTYLERLDFNNNGNIYDATIGKRILMVLGLGLAGGFIAPLARDIVAVLPAQRK